MIRYQQKRCKLLEDELGIDDGDDKSTSDRLKAIEDRHGAKHGETNRARLAYLENAVGPKPNPTHSQVERCKQLETHMGMDVCDIRVGIRYTYISGNVGPVPKPVKNQSQTCKFQFGTVVYSLQPNIASLEYTLLVLLLQASPDRFSGHRPRLGFLIYKQRMGCSFQRYTLYCAPVRLLPSTNMSLIRTFLVFFVHCLTHTMASVPP